MEKIKENPWKFLITLGGLAVCFMFFGFAAVMVTIRLIAPSLSPFFLFLAFTGGGALGVTIIALVLEGSSLDLTWWIK
jgi:hypothetical protein